ncbi:hypothetical protein O9X98_10655 [Agrobacterium salinitolerans]|nr:hypothetical protein [Agrobacterium salinitolerans]
MTSKSATTVSTSLPFQRAALRSQIYGASVSDFSGHVRRSLDRWSDRAKQLTINPSFPVLPPHLMADADRIITHDFGRGPVVVDPFLMDAFDFVRILADHDHDHATLDNDLGPSQGDTDEVHRLHTQIEQHRKVGHDDMRTLFRICPKYTSQIARITGDIVKESSSVTADVLKQRHENGSLYRSTRIREARVADALFSTRSYVWCTGNATRVHMAPNHAKQFSIEVTSYLDDLFEGPDRKMLTEFFRSNVRFLGNATKTVNGIQIHYPSWQLPLVPSIASNIITLVQDIDRHALVDRRVIALSTTPTGGLPPPPVKPNSTRPSIGQPPSV